MPNHDDDDDDDDVVTVTLAAVMCRGKLLHRDVICSKDDNTKTY